MTRGQANKAPKIRVLCVDDHGMVREGLAGLIAREPDMETVGLAATADEAIRLHKQVRPDVTLMDLQLGTSSGIDAIRAICQTSTSALVIALTVCKGEEDIHQALEAGAVAYLLKDAVSKDLIQTIRSVHAGLRPPLPPMVKAVLDRRQARPSLTRREREVLQLAAQGLQTSEIAVALGISAETVQIHVHHLLDKLEARDRLSAVSIALRRGIIHIS